jgi:acetylornithine/N-succinyldiaminopimelate aminotransferase
MADWRQLDETYIMSTYRRLPIAIAKGEGNYLYDVEGHSYLDLFTGLAVNILGHSHPKIVQALREQGEKFLHISNVFLNTPAIQLAESLIKQTIPGRVFFVNSGTEATEAAIKLIHKWCVNEGNGKEGIVVLKSSFHGRTLGALRLTRQKHVYQDFPVVNFPVYEVDAGDIDALKQVCEQHQPAAILVEPVLGSGGVIPLSESYLQTISELCTEYGMLCCIDEIQTGVGRTGTLFAYQHAGIEPDLILFAKGIGGGLPLGGIIGGKKIDHLFKPGDHGTTFAPSPLSATLGNVVLEVLLQDGLLEQARANSDYLWEKLADLKEKYPTYLQQVRGKGMMIGLPTGRSPEEVSDLQRDLLKKGVFIDVTQKTIIRLLPPLTLSKEEIDLFIQTFDGCLSARV